MVNRGIDFCAHPGDLAFEGLDALLELLDRQRVEVLLRELHQRIAGLAREELFEIHGRKTPPKQGWLSTKSVLQSRGLTLDDSENTASRAGDLRRRHLQAEHGAMTKLPPKL